jgi:hypothetical protein
VRQAFKPINVGLHRRPVLGLVHLRHQLRFFLLAEELEQAARHHGHQQHDEGQGTGRDEEAPLFGLVPWTLLQQAHHVQHGHHGQGQFHDHQDDGDRPEFIIAPAHGPGRSP